MILHFSTFNSQFFRQARFEPNSSLACYRSVFVCVRCWSVFDAFVSPHLYHPHIILAALETMKNLLQSTCKPLLIDLDPSSDDFNILFVDLPLLVLFADFVCHISFLCAVCLLAIPFFFFFYFFLIKHRKEFPRTLIQMKRKKTQWIDVR